MLVLALVPIAVVRVRIASSLREPIARLRSRRPWDNIHVEVVRTVTRVDLDLQSGESIRARCSRGRRPYSYGAIVAASRKHERRRRLVPGHTGEVTVEVLSSEVVQQCRRFAVPDVYVAR